MCEIFYDEPKLSILRTILQKISFPKKKMNTKTKELEEKNKLNF